MADTPTVLDGLVNLDDQVKQFAAKMRAAMQEFKDEQSKKWTEMLASIPTAKLAHMSPADAYVTSRRLPSEAGALFMHRYEQAVQEATQPKPVAKAS